MHNYGILGTLTQAHHERQAPRGCGTAGGAVAKEVCWSHCARGALVHLSTWSFVLVEHYGALIVEHKGNHMGQVLQGGKNGRLMSFFFLK